MVRNLRGLSGSSFAVVCLLGSASMAAAAPTYYTDQTGWGNNPGYGNEGYSSNYTAAYNMSGQSTSRSKSGRSSRSSQRVQPNTYSEQAAAQPNTYTGNAWAPSPNTYTDGNGYAVQGTADQSQSQYQGSQWNSSYQTQQQAPKRRGVISRMFNREPESYQNEQQPQANSGSSRFSASGILRGVASWYGRDFHGGKTANGERYDMNSMTAAHKTLPFGTLVKVTNECNGRECVVRINNRGPYSKGRIIDLSKAAANQIGMLGRGVSKVSMQVLGQ